MTVASQVACTETPHGPCLLRTGMASRVNAASQPKTTTAQATPVASARPRPWTRPAPQVTTSAAAMALAWGRLPSRSGPMIASTAGTQATATARAAGLACLEPSTRARLNRTRPVTPIPASHSHSVPRGRLSVRPVILASVTRMRQARPYLTASAVDTGAPASSEETATLPPTQTMAVAPVATPRSVLRLGAEVAALAAGGAGVTMAVGVAGAGAAGRATVTVAVGVTVAFGAAVAVGVAVTGLASGAASWRWLWMAAGFGGPTMGTTSDLLVPLTPRMGGSSMTKGRQSGRSGGPL